jgi:hypothetical protein
LAKHGRNLLLDCDSALGCVIASPYFMVPRFLSMTSAAWLISSLCLGATSTTLPFTLRWLSVTGAVLTFGVSFIVLAPILCKR